MLFFFATIISEQAVWPQHFGVEESPSSTGQECLVTPGGGDPKESATERKPPMFA